MSDNPDPENRPQHRDQHQPHHKDPKWKPYCHLALINLPNMVIIILVIIAICTVEDLIPPKKPPVLCEDPTISYKYQENTISSRSNHLVSFLAPLPFFIIIEFINNYGSWHEMLMLIVRWLIFFYITTTLETLFVIIAKNMASEQRPHFLDTCSPDLAVNCTPGELLFNYKCTGKFPLKSAINSFPSGHTGLSSCAGLFTAAFVLVRFNMQNSVCALLLKPAIILLILFWPIVNAITRVTDRHHHWYDVIAGGAIGSSFALYGIFLASKFRLTPKKEASSPAIQGQRQV